MSIDYEKLFAALPGGVVYVVEGSKVGWVNAEACRIYGAPVDRIVGRDFRDLLTPDQAEVVFRRNSDRREGRVAIPAYETTLLRDDGTTVRIELEARYLGPNESLALFRDVSDRSRNVALVQGLSSVAAHVQRAYSIEIAMATAGEGLDQLGFGFAVFRVVADYVTLAYVGMSGRRAPASELFERPFRDTMIPLSELPRTSRVLRDGGPAFIDDLIAAGGPFFESALGAPAEVVREAFVLANASKAVLHPIRIRGSVWGLCIITSNTLTSPDASALSLFAAQLSSAFEAADTIETLGRRNQELAAINAVARAGAGAQLDVLLSKLARIAAEASSSDAAGIFLPDATRERLVLHGSHGYSEQAKSAFGQLSATGATGEVVRTLRPRTITLMEWPESCRAELHESGCHEMAILPLATQGRVLGTLNLRRAEPRPYTEEDLRAAALLASQIAVQVENARLYSDASRRVEMLSFLNGLSRIGAEGLDIHALVEGTIAQIPRVLDVDAVCIYLATPDGALALEGSLGVYPPKDGQARFETLELSEATINGRAALSRSTVIFNQSNWPSGSLEMATQLGLRHAIGVPLLSQERVIGVLTASRRSDRPFDRDDVALLETTAGHVSAAVEQARLFEAERRRARDLAVINEVGALVGRHLDLGVLVDTAVRRIAELADMPHAFLMLRDEHEPVLHLVKSNLEGAGFSVRIDENSAAAHALRTSSPQLVTDVRTDPRCSPALAERFGHRTLMALPLIARGEVIGVVVLGDTREDRTFSPGAVERVQAMSNHLAAAVANARMYEEERKRVAELQRLQAELVKRERLAALGELAALVAHEVRNPLAVIFNSLASLKRARGTRDAEVLLDIVGEEAERLNSIVSDLLDFARPIEPKLRSEPLERILAGAAEVATSALNASASRVTVNVDPALSITADARLLRQAFINLLVNALQAMPRGGDVKVEAHTACESGRELVQVAVTDAGPGMPDEVRQKLFEPFFTTKATGTGLGLAVVKRTVEAHQGEIFVRSEVGQGTTFTVSLPLVPSAPAS